MGQDGHSIRPRVEAPPPRGHSRTRPDILSFFMLEAAPSGNRGPAGPLAAACPSVERSSIRARGPRGLLWNCSPARGGRERFATAARPAAAADHRTGKCND